MGPGFLVEKVGESETQFLSIGERMKMKPTNNNLKKEDIMSKSTSTPNTAEEYKAVKNPAEQFSVRQLGSVLTKVGGTPLVPATLKGMSKQQVIDRIEKVIAEDGAKVTNSTLDGSKSGSRKKGLGVGQFVYELIATDPEITFDEAKPLVNEAFPGNHFSAKCLSWYKCKAKK